MALQILVTYINTQFLGAASAQFVLGQHAQNGIANHFGGLLLHASADRNFLETAGITAVMAIHLLIDFVSGEANLFGVDDHDVIATFLIRGKAGLVLAD